MNLLWWKKNIPKETFDVGISVATVFLSNGTTITVTRKGDIWGGQYLSMSDRHVDRAMNEKWVYADNGTYYNSYWLHHYTVTTKPYFVYEDNTAAVQA